MTKQKVLATLLKSKDQRKILMWIWIVMSLLNTNLFMSTCFRGIFNFDLLATSLVLILGGVLLTNFIHELDNVENLLGMYLESDINKSNPEGVPFTEWSDKNFNWDDIK
jgi:hypothetical protein